jgi:hypothetical protein
MIVLRVEFGLEPRVFETTSDAWELKSCAHRALKIYPCQDVHDRALKAFINYHSGNICCPPIAVSAVRRIRLLENGFLDNRLVQVVCGHTGLPSEVGFCFDVLVSRLELLRVAVLPTGISADCHGGCAL